jgi:long-chain acyl-CoA synthetase
MPMLNLAQVIEDNARKYPDREAVVSGATRLTFGQLNTMANQVANGLQALGVGQGDNVALTCPNVPYFHIAYYGILKTGAAVVPLNILLASPEIAYHLKDCNAKVFFCFEGSAALPVGETGHQGLVESETGAHFILMTADPLATPPKDGMTTLGTLMSGQPATFETASTSPEDTAVILYTSGTTGRPKGAELTQSNLVLNAMVARDLYLPVAQEHNVALVALPLFHVFGMTVQMNAMALLCSTQVLLPRFDPALALETMLTERVNFFCGVPTMFWGLLNEARSTGINTTPIADNMRICISGGAALPVELLRAFEQTFSVPILEGFGLSETSPVICFNQLGFERKPGSIGRPLFATEMRLVDDSDTPVPQGQAGEIVVRGHSIMKGYYNRPEATSEAMRGGWFHTGDIATMDQDGYFYIVDRKKDLIIRGGYNVYPRELEEVLMTHPAVSLAAVIGVPHPVLGEEVKAYIISKPDATITVEEMSVWCKDQMAAYKYPRLIEFRDSLPMTATGKILKRQLREEEQGSRE